MSRTRWRTCTPAEVPTVRRRLEQWPCEVGGAVRHMFALSSLESAGPGPLRIAEQDGAWACAVVYPGRLVVPCGDAEVIERAGAPTRRWRLMVGDAPPADALLGHTGSPAGLRVHVQRFLTLDHGRVPSADDLPDPGLRPAQPDDVGGLAELAVRLHIDDRFGPHPGRAGLRGYARRFEQTVRQELVWCVGPVGDPVCKVERSVSSDRYGIQLAGIVVRPDRRGEGLGRRAVATAVRHALADGPRDRPVTLHVRADNVRALRAYAAVGFVDREEWRLAVRQ